MTICNAMSPEEMKSYTIDELTSLPLHRLDIILEYIWVIKKDDFIYLGIILLTRWWFN